MIKYTTDMPTRVCGCPGASGDPHLPDCDFFNSDEEAGPDAKVRLLVSCTICQTIYMVDMNLNAYIKWAIHRRLIQEVAPDMSTDDRELLISHTCPTCWDDMLKENEDD